MTIIADDLLRAGGKGMRVLAAIAMMVSLTACPTMERRPLLTSGAPLPEFRLPAPKPSARFAVPRAQLPATASLATVNQRLRKALNKGGYHEVSYFVVRDGFALATRMERIREDGRSWQVPAERWQTGPVSLLPSDAGVLDQLWSVLGGSPGPGHAGRYRVLVFLVTTASVQTTGQPLTGEGAQGLLDRGGQSLPASISNRPFGPDHEVTALIYEFQRPSVGAAMQILRPSNVLGQDHLQRGRILPL
jgi:hypothetical protein